MKKVTIENRAQLAGEYVSEQIYASGLTRLVEYLLADLSDLLELEGRRFGIVLSYFDSISKVCQKMELSNDDETSGKIIYLYKPLVISEFKRLCRKKLSKADAVITILKKLLEMIAEIETFPYLRENNTILKIITKLYENIRNKAKFTNLDFLEKTITDFMNEGIIGKYELEKFSILEEEEKRSKKKLEGDGVIIEKNNSKILEITWKEN